MTNDIARRTFLTAAAAATAAGALGTASRAQQAVPNSTGTNLTKTAAPANAADCHMHI
jgi:guanine deaminase